ncbi:hypothetical protein X961_5183 [Burkholderia pseudomallei MSHR5613]|nr:hypothetical protein X961_5183 [Burkholderia pseudomallei MSHR5613]
MCGEVRAQRGRIERLDAQAQMIHVPSLSRRSAACPIDRRANREQIDQRASGAQLNEPQFPLLFFDVAAQHVAIETGHRSQIGGAQHHVIDLVDVEFHRGRLLREAVLPSVDGPCGARLDGAKSMDEKKPVHVRTGLIHIRRRHGGDSSHYTHRDGATQYTLCKKTSGRQSVASAPQQNRAEAALALRLRQRIGRLCRRYDDGSNESARNSAYASRATPTVTGICSDFARST